MRGLVYYYHDYCMFFPPDFEPVTMSIQLEYVGGLTLDLTLGLGQPFRMRSSYLGERIIR